MKGLFYVHVSELLLQFGLNDDSLSVSFKDSPVCSGFL